MREPRLATVTTLLAAVLWFWLAMMLVHELGHVLTALATGGTIVSLELRPGYLSHTLVRPNPNPSAVVWGGFLSGWIVPQFTRPAWSIEGGMIGLLLRAWAEFCLLAGGSYLAIGFGERLTDTGQLVAAGWPVLILVAIGLLVAVLGYWRSRTAWILIHKAIEQRPLSWRDAVGWWLFLAGWWGAQNILAIGLEP